MGQKRGIFKKNSCSSTCLKLCRSALSDNTWISRIRHFICMNESPEAEFLDEIQTKVLKAFLLAIQSHLNSFALKFLFLKTHATSYSFYSSATVHCKRESRKTWSKTIPPSLWFKKFIQKPLKKTLKLSRLCPESSTKLCVHEFCFWPGAAS